MKLPPFFVSPETVIEPGKLNAVAFDTVLGNYWYIARASHPRFMVSINESPYMPSDLATGDTFPTDFEIKVIRIWNIDPTIPLTVLIKTGKGAPIDNKLNVYQNEVAPMLRAETPSVIGDAVSTENGAAVVVDVWYKLLDADTNRAEVWLSTDAAALAYWGKDGGGAEKPDHNIFATKDVGGFVKINTSAAIWIRHKEAGKSIRAITFGY
ncbi:MAG TPA: hypothetical protein VL357_01650 [Rariglobus sp.]|nr:hypothetical protein [Rariglobus sp.]